jgi:hypothetical protein
VTDRGQTGEVITGTGDQLPTSVEKKNLDDANLDPRAKGHDQYAKHARQDNPMNSLKHGAGSHNVDAAPGEEEESQGASEQAGRAVGDARDCTFDVHTPRSYEHTKAKRLEIKYTKDFMFVSGV